MLNNVTGHDILDWIGMVPLVGTVADGANAIWYLAEGDVVNASFSGVALIPVIGDALGAGKNAGKVALKYSDEMVETLAKWGNDVVPKADEVAEAVQDVVKGSSNVLPETDEAIDAIQNISKNDRNAYGVVTGVGQGNVSRMMHGTDGDIGVIPQEIADKMLGQDFNTFDEFRSAFWKEVANSSYANEFSTSNITRMSKGYAPKVATSQQYGKLTSYILHLKKPIHAGGSVYDLDNLVIVTPRIHQEILDRAYHFGN